MTVLITGGSSGIGEAIAYECAKKGDTLFICGRDSNRLDKVAEKCRTIGAEAVYAKVIDVSKEVETEIWIRESNLVSPLERVFSNAGIGTGEETTENIRKTFDVNVEGNLNTVLPVIEIFRSRGNKGLRQILITASIAGYGPLSACPAYSGSKAAMKTWGLALRGMLKKEGIKVSVICPGFVRSRITDLNTCPMPFFMEADVAAKTILAAADKNIGLIAFPWPMRLASWFLSILPFKLNELITSLLPQKISNR